MSMHEARFEIERELLERHASVSLWRFIPYPSDGRLVLACAELANGEEIQKVFDLGAPMDVATFCEFEVYEAFFRMDSREVH